MSGDYQNEWLDPATAARYLQIPVATLYRLILERKLDAARDPVRVLRADLDACIERCRLRPGELAHLDPNAKRRPAPGTPVRRTAKATPDRRRRRRRP